jgi:hypothetical protein
MFHLILKFNKNIIYQSPQKGIKNAIEEKKIFFKILLLLLFFMNACSIKSQYNIPQYQGFIPERKSYSIGVYFQPIISQTKMSDTNCYGQDKHFYVPCGAITVFKTIDALNSFFNKVEVIESPNALQRIVEVKQKNLDMLLEVYLTKHDQLYSKQIFNISGNLKYHAEYEIKATLFDSNGARIGEATGSYITNDSGINPLFPNKKDLANLNDQVSLAVDKSLSEIILTLSATYEDKEKPSIPHKGRVLFEDHFIDNRNNWGVGETAIAISYITNDKYYLEYKPNDNLDAISHNPYFNLSKDIDFIIETAFEKISGDTHGSGLVWGYSNDNYNYSLTISSVGMYTFAKREGDTIEYIIPWTRYNYTNNSKNTLTIVKEGNTTKFYINDKYVDEVSNIYLYGTLVGFTAGENQKTAFDYIRISEIKKGSE